MFEITALFEQESEARNEDLRPQAELSMLPKLRPSPQMSMAEFLDSLRQHRAVSSAVLETQSLPLADFLPTLTIAAKNLATKMTNHNVQQANLRGEPAITSEHVQNNTSVRLMLGQRGIRPEALPAEQDIKKLERNVKADEKKSLEKQAGLLPCRRSKREAEQPPPLDAPSPRRPYVSLSRPKSLDSFTHFLDPDPTNAGAAWRFERSRSAAAMCRTQLIA